jgi:hypothetical protein
LQVRRRIDWDDLAWDLAWAYTSVTTEEEDSEELDRTPDYSFYIIHRPSGKKVMFDLGLNKVSSSGPSADFTLSSTHYLIRNIVLTSPCCIQDMSVYSPAIHEDLPIVLPEVSRSTPLLLPCLICRLIAYLHCDLRSHTMLLIYYWRVELNHRK